MTYNGRMYLEWSSAISPKLNNGRSVYCALNGVRVACAVDGPRRLVVQPQANTQQRLLPNEAYTLVVGGVAQPRALDTFGKIWLALSLSDSQTLVRNNDTTTLTYADFNEQGEVSDRPI